MDEMDLLEQFVAEQPPPDPDQLRRARDKVIGQITRPSSTRHRRRAYAVAGGLAAVLVSAAASAILLTASSTPTKPSQGLVPEGSLGLAVNWAMPLPDAHKTTLTAARTAAGFTIPLLSAATRSAMNLHLSQVWINPARAIALVYDGGKITITLGPASYTDPGQTFRRQLSEIKIGRAAIRHVNGHPAFVAWPRTDANRSNPALVEFSLHGLDINVISTSLTPKTLLTVAASIQPAQP